MEAQGARRFLTRSTRKPLSDRTNTSHNISSSSSCSSKLSEANNKRSRASPATNVPITTNLGNASSNPSTPPPSAAPPPSSPKTSSHHGTVGFVDLEASGPISLVYSRRSSKRKRKGKGKALAVSVSSAPTLKISNSRKQSGVVEVANSPKAKALTVPCRKKHRAVLSEQDSSQDMWQDPELQDYIKKQKEYFKKIDEYELQEEVTDDEQD